MGSNRGFSVGWCADVRQAFCECERDLGISRDGEFSLNHLREVVAPKAE